MISAERTLQILRDEGCSSRVIRHSRTVSEKSVEIARNISDSGHEVDLKRVEIGGLLHDVGRSRTHGISHGVEGAKILRERGLEEFAGFAENHLGAGIGEEEARNLGLGERDYLPESLEEKIVTYGDNLVRGDKIQSYEEGLEELREELGPDHPSVERFIKLHRELSELGGVD